MLLLRGIEFPHVGAVDDVEIGVFAGTDGELPDLAGGIFLADQQSSAGTEVGVAAIFLRLVVHLEVVGDGESALGGEAKEGVAVVAVGGKAGGIQSGVEQSVGVEQEDVAGAIGGHAGAGAPDRAFVAVGSDVEHGGLRQSGRVVAHDPSGVGTDVAVRSPGEINRAADQEQAGALFILGLGSKIT